VNATQSNSTSKTTGAISSDRAVSMVGANSPRWGFAVASGILGWILDAFNFFVPIFLVDVLAKNFHVSKGAIVWSITATLVTRPLGAMLLGSLADRFGRRLPLIACVLYFSLVSALTPYAPSYAAFILLRALYGIGMGGYWGIGASMVMESSPVRWRGLFSGIMQAGYSLGYLLAAVAIRMARPDTGWKWMFLIGLALAFLISILTSLSSEPYSWRKNQIAKMSETWGILFRYKARFAYLVLLMTAITCLSHGTQDLYPDFLTTMHHVPAAVLSNVAILYNIGAILGAIFVGYVSDNLGRRNGIFIALALSFVSIPLWAFGTSIAILALGAFLMQFGVQGVFGVIPAHLNEMSPAGLRSLFSGVIYQLGMLIGSPSVSIQFELQKHIGYPWALTLFEVCVIISLLFLFGLGTEKQGQSFDIA